MSTPADKLNELMRLDPTAIRSLMLGGKVLTGPDLGIKLGLPLVNESHRLDMLILFNHLLEGKERVIFDDKVHPGYFYMEYSHEGR